MKIIWAIVAFTFILPHSTSIDATILDELTEISRTGSTNRQVEQIVSNYIQIGDDAQDVIEYFISVGCVYTGSPVYNLSENTCAIYYINNEKYLFMNYMIRQNLISNVDARIYFFLEKNIVHKIIATISLTSI